VYSQFAGVAQVGAIIWAISGGLATVRSGLTEETAQIPQRDRPHIRYNCAVRVWEN
jgi:hypothetical protein